MRIAHETTGDYITNLHYGIAADEPEIRVFYIFYPEQPEKRGIDPDDSQEGIPADTVIEEIEGVSRPLTIAEHAAFFADKEGMQNEEERAFEIHLERLEGAREDYQEAKYEARRDREIA